MSGIKYPERVYEIEPSLITWKDRLKLLFRQKQVIRTRIDCDSQYGDGWIEYDTIYTKFKTDTYGNLYVIDQCLIHTIEALDDIQL